MFEKFKEKKRKEKEIKKAYMLSDVNSRILERIENGEDSKALVE